MATRMRAVAYRENPPADDAACLLDVALPVPAPGPHDLLVKVEAVAVNPVDCKARRKVDPAGALRVLVTRCTTRVPSTGPGRTPTVIGTASRPETVDFARCMGVHHVVDHHQPLLPQLAGVAPSGLVHVFSAAGSTRNLGVYAEALKPFGQIVAVDDVDDVTQIARLVDPGIVHAGHLREAHRVLESGRTVGKMTLTGF